MPVLPDLGLAAAFAAVLFFILLGVLVVFVESFNVRTFVGIFFVLVGLAIGLVILGEAGLGVIVTAVLAALIADQAIELLTTV